MAVKKTVPVKEPESKCPHCGYCPHCGRSDHTKFVPYPYPYYPYRPYVQYPTITWQQTPCGSNQINTSGTVIN